MKIISFCTYILVGLLFCGNVFAAERKGIQAIGLSRWSDASTGNLAAAIKESGCRKFEFSFMPFFNPEDPFKNVETLLAIPKVGKVETIYLSWRDEKVMNGGWPDALDTLKQSCPGGEQPCERGAGQGRNYRPGADAGRSVDAGQVAGGRPCHRRADGQRREGFFPPLGKFRQRHASSFDQHALEERQESHLHLDSVGGASHRPSRPRPGDQQ